MDEVLCFAAHSAGFAFACTYRRILNRLNPAYPQYLVMRALWRKVGVTLLRLHDRGVTPTVAEDVLDESVHAS